MKGPFCMNRYENINCPICEKPLETNVVVCPICGAPYHLDCYKQNNVCVFDDLHKNHQDWIPPQIQDDKKNTIDGEASFRCSRCGTVNPPTGLFCQVCGNTLAENENQPFNPTMKIPPSMPFNPFINPFGGISPEDDIDGVKAKDLAIIVGKNSHYYVPKFKQLSKTKGKGRVINWGSFIFTSWYFIYRKMYGIGIAIAIINIILNIPYALLISSTMTNIPSLLPSTINIDLLTALNAVCYLFVLVFKFACGFFANSLYKKHVFKKINKLNNTRITQGEDAYFSILAKKGGIAIKLIFTLMIIYLVSYLLCMIYIII